MHNGNDLLADFDEPNPPRDEKNKEQCPRCGEIFGGDNTYQGTLYTKDGREAGEWTDTDPFEGPFFHEKCHDERVEELEAVQNALVEALDDE